MSWWALWALWASFFGMARADDALGPATAVEWKRCYPKYVRQEAMCTTLLAPVDVKDPTGETLLLNVVKLPAIRSNAEPDPVFILAGGPGQGATEAIATLYPALRKVHQRRTLVFIDQRGTGKSEPLDCDLPDDADGIEVPKEALEHCWSEMPRDPKWYQTPRLADDTDWVRRQLGYEQVNLYGVSYGTRLGLTIMQRHPSTVRSAVLDGVVPFQRAIGGDFGVGVRDALEAVLADCTSDEDCRSAFPNLEDEYRQVVSALQNGSKIVRHPHPVTGVMTETTVTDQAFWAVLQQLLYQSTTASLIPYAIHSIASEDDWSTIVGWLGNSPFDGIPIGLYLSIMCAEDVSQIEFSKAPEMDIGVLSTTQLQEMCAIWKTTPSTEPVLEWTSDVPTLLLSGEFDPVTPPAYGDLALSTLRNATHVIVSGMGHNTIHQPCISDSVTDFYQELEPQKLDVRCASEIRRPPFVLSAAGTAP